MKKLSAAEAYDLVADEYDNSFCSNVSQAEDLTVYAFVQEFLKNGLTLDLGCGTGSLLEHIKLKEHEYIGIDLSKKMIERAVRKFPDYHFKNRDVLAFTRLMPDESVENVISLFGSISYVDPAIYEEINRVLRPGSLFFLMFYNERYRTRPTYIQRRHKVEVPFHTYSEVKHLLPLHDATGLNFEGDRLCQWPVSLLTLKYGVEMFTIGRLIPTRAYFTVVIGEKDA
jgi:SAM-dependent methyltransferase